MSGRGKDPPGDNCPRKYRNTRKKESDSAASLCSVALVGEPWINQPVFFVDFEGSRLSGVLEFGVVTLLEGRVVETRTGCCAPTGAVRPEDVAVHGLTEAKLAGRTPFADEWEYFASLRERGPLAAHYAGVENALLKSVWPYPRNSPDFARPGERLIEWGPWIDSARLYAQLYPQFTSGGLEHLVAASGLQAQLDGAAAEHCPRDRCHYHAALYDALAGAMLLAALARDPQVGRMSVMQLLALSTLDGTKRDALQQRELF
jgi:DNA polymerase III epsilon subunit-like protein